MNPAFLYTDITEISDVFYRGEAGAGGGGVEGRVLKGKHVT